MDAFTPRNAVKFAVKSVISLKTASIAKNAITDYTRFENDDIVVKLVPGMIGWYVSDKLKPYSDKMVDKTADYIAEKRAAKAAKKDTTEQ